MNFFDYRIKKVFFTDTDICIETVNGKTASQALKNFKALFNATVADRNKYEIVGNGYALYWKELDEDISAAGFFE